MRKLELKEMSIPIEKILAHLAICPECTNKMLSIMYHAGAKVKK